MGRKGGEGLYGYLVEIFLRGGEGEGGHRILVPDMEREEEGVERCQECRRWEGGKGGLNQLGFF